MCVYRGTDKGVWARSSRSLPTVIPTGTHPQRPHGPAAPAATTAAPRLLAGHDFLGLRLLREWEPGRLHALLLPGPRRSRDGAAGGWGGAYMRVISFCLYACCVWIDTPHNTPISRSYTHIVFLKTKAGRASLSHRPQAPTPPVPRQRRQQARQPPPAVEAAAAAGTAAAAGGDSHGIRGA